MYTQEQLQQKNLKELKEIGWQLNVLPAGDRRCRQSWIDALVGAEFPLLEVSPAEVVESVQEPIALAVETSPGVEVDPVSDAINFPSEVCKCSICGSVRDLYLTKNHLDRAVIYCLRCDYRPKNYPGVTRLGVQESIKMGDWVKVIRKPRLATGVKRGEIFQVLRINYTGDLVIDNPHENSKLILSARIGFLDPSEVCLVPRSNRLDTPVFIDVVKRNFPDRFEELLQNPLGVKADRVQERKEISGFKADRVQERKEISGFKVDRVQEPIAQAVQTSPGVQAEAVAGITFTARFLATYPPYFGEVSYKADCTGQLNLLEPDIEDEPPDPDDFQSLDEFRDAMDLWDSEHGEPLEVLLTSLDSMVYWAPCPDEWYWPFQAEDVKRCPCGAVAAVACDGTTVIYISPDGIIFISCYKHQLADGLGARSPPGGDAVF